MSIEQTKIEMATDNGDHEMADAAAGAEVNGASDEFAHEKQRLRMVRLSPQDRKQY